MDDHDALRYLLVRAIDTIKAGRKEGKIRGSDGKT